MQKRISRLTLLLAAIAAAALLAFAFLGAKARPNVILIVIDTLRADHVGSYGYPRPTTPHLDRFAQEYNRCEFALSTAPWTPASVASILSGEFAESHGYMPPSRAETARRSNVVLRQDLRLLSEALRENGYATGAVSSNAWVSPELGFGQGFDRFFIKSGLRGDQITIRAKRMLGRLKESGKPFFLYVHYLDPHEPYRPRRHEFRDYPPLPGHDPSLAETIKLYDSEIRFVDREVGKLFRTLRDGKLFDDSIIIITADHGEQFKEHGYMGHGNQVYNTETHVPLLFKLGGDGPRGKVLEHTVSTIDIYATILDAAGIPLSGAQSIPLTDEAALKSRQGVFSWIRGDLAQRALTEPLGRKLIVGSNESADGVNTDDPAQNIIGLFDTRRDYGELAPLDSPGDLTSLQRRWLDLSSRLTNGIKTEADAEPLPAGMLEQLRSLGYLK